VTKTYFVRLAARAKSIGLPIAVSEYALIRVACSRGDRVGAIAARAWYEALLW
jgi:hypothetical protein